MLQYDVEVNSRKIVNEILNSRNDYSELYHLINEENIAAIDRPGVCGETPAHISIYTQDITMLQMLLRVGFQVNQPNRSAGDTIAHVCARLGDLKSLQLIYETGMCDLHVKNNNGFEPLDIARAPFHESDFITMKLFRNWSSAYDTDEAQVASIIAGRQQCCVYLKRKIHVDRMARIHRVYKQTESFTHRRQVVGRSIRGVGAQYLVEYTPLLSFPSTALKDETEAVKQQSKILHWNKEDSTFFHSQWGREYGREKIGLTSVACEYVNTSIKIGLHRAQLIERRRTTGLPLES